MSPVAASRMPPERFMRDTLDEFFARAGCALAPV